MSYTAQGGSITTATQAAIKIIDDPHLPEVACQVLRLNKIEEGKPLGTPCAKIPKNYKPGQGIGLRYAAGPLRVFVKSREKPWLTYIVIGSTFGVVFLAGYMVGRPTRKKGDS